MATTGARPIHRVDDDYEADSSRIRTDSASPASGSATDVSEDSVEVKIQPVAAMPTAPVCSSMLRRNKRKSSEPRKLKDTTNVPAPTPSSTAAAACKPPRFWTDADAGSDATATSGGRLAGHDQSRAADDGKERPTASQFTQPRKSTGGERSRNRKSTSAKVIIEDAHRRGASDRTNRRVGSGSRDGPTTTTSGKTADGDKRHSTPTGSGTKLTGSRAVSDTEVHGVGRLPSGNRHRDKSSDDVIINNHQQQPFLLNLPFDVRNILGPSAASLLQGATSASSRRPCRDDATPATTAATPSSIDDVDSPFRHFRNLLLSERILQEVDNDEEEDEEDDDDKEVRELVHPFGSTAKRKRDEAATTTTTFESASGLNAPPSSSTPLADGGGNYEAVSPPCSSFADSNGACGGGLSGATYNKQRNYKNMTRERRVEANARERTRVHTISSAFDELRRAVPSYSCHQKLSKLAILRIACSYILALASLNDLNYSGQAVGPTFGECVDQCTQTIQAEGKARKRKD